MIALTKAVYPLSDLSNDIERHRLLVTARDYTKRIMTSAAMRISLKEMAERLTVLRSLPRNEVISILTRYFRGGLPPCSTSVWRERLNIDPPRPQIEPHQVTESTIVREIHEVGTAQTSQFYPSGRRALNLDP